MSKQYGLIIPGQQKKPEVSQQGSRATVKPSIFDESSESENENAAAPLLKMKTAPMMPSLMEKRMARRLQQKALEEDPTVFQYDEVYDDMETKREDEKQSKSNEPKKPKYIGRLMEYAERRKLENELRLERQVQKEREQEGEEFKDKESFVTAAYRKKLEDMRKLEEEEKRDEYLEAIGDVTKQKDLDGFYRHLYEQKTGLNKEVKKPNIPNNSESDDEIAYKPIKSNNTKPQKRAYRKRQSSDEDCNQDTAPTSGAEAKRVHLQNNIDADSDFSIDSSSSDEDDDKNTTNSKNSNDKKPLSTDVDEKGTLKEKESASSKLDTENEKVGDKTPTNESTEKDPPTDSTSKTSESPKPKKNKAEIWKKRTVGEVYEAAVRRYYERKSAREV